MQPVFDMSAVAIRLGGGIPAASVPYVDPMQPMQPYQPPALAPNPFR
jgi:hypothetical protein